MNAIVIALTAIYGIGFSKAIGPVWSWVIFLFLLNDKDGDAGTGETNDPRR